MNDWQIPKNNLNINASEVHIWKVQIPYHMFDFKIENFNSNYSILSNISVINQFRKVIDEADLKSATRFYKLSDQIRAISTKYILKKIISYYLKLDHNLIQFFYNEFSKPFICCEINSISLQFNISHAGEFIALAFTCGAQIGIDIELYDCYFDQHSLAHHVFSIQELSKWQILSDQEKLDSFYHVWSCKEAILKGIGIGLAHMPNNISVTICPNIPPAILNFKDCKYEDDLNAWSIQKFNIQSNYSAIYAVRKKEFNTIFYKWSWDDFVVFNSL